MKIQFCIFLQTNQSIGSAYFWEKKKEKHKATNQSKFVRELKSHAIREAP